VTSTQKKQSIFLLVLVIIAGIFLAPTFIDRDKLPERWPSQAIKLGLDLKGGLYLVMEVQTKEAIKSRLTGIAQAVKSELRKENVKVIRARERNGKFVEITLLDKSGVDSAKKFVKEEYKELAFSSTEDQGGRVKVSFEIDDLTAKDIEKRAVEQAIETIRNRVDAHGVAEPTIQRSGEKQIVVQLPGVKDKDFDDIKQTIGSVAKLDFRIVANPSAEQYVPTRSFKSRDGGEILLEDDVLMTGDAIDTANVEPDPQTNEIQVSFRLNSAGAKTFDRVTSENVGRQMAIVLDDVVQSAPNINQRISGGSAVITGGFSFDEARLISIVLRSGALPAPLKFMEERSVGASLGEDSINKGITSMFFGSVLVVIFMCGYYRKSGVLSIVALALNCLFLLFLLSALGATLTLPGLAGLALTVGMAVDANVIIYERIREELRRGASNRAAVVAGFDKAHWTILDSNITTLLSGLILYALGTGPIKGFAATLSLGIVTTVFSALFISKLGFEVLKLEDKKGKLSI
jgi:preprotein translocase subunit SecD